MNINRTMNMTFILAAIFSFAGAALATPVTGAAFTTTDPTIDGSGHCKNGNEAINCNIYDGKQYVWLTGGPLAAALGDGTYFFAVLDPGGQGGNQNPNDGTDKNLSDLSPTSNTGAGDAWTNRVFTITNGVISYSGTHDFDSANSKIRLMPYDNTTNPGGVYILAICNIADATGSETNPPGVNPSDCKYDAFKVKLGTEVTADALQISKSANGSFDKTFGWSITKSVDKTEVDQVGGTATFNYTVSVSHDSGVDSNVGVSGVIGVINPNTDASNNLVNVDITSVIDQLSDLTVCSVVNGGAQTLTQFLTDFDYTCSLLAVPSSPLDNTATVTWPDQNLSSGASLTGGSADAVVKDISFTENDIDECVTVTDTYAGVLGTVCIGDANPTTFTYSRTIAVPANDCVSYDNTATFTTNDSGATGSSSQTVKVCGPAKTGALTIGFWKTTNGQSLIKNYCNNGGNSLGTYLASLGTGQGPFANAPTTCNSLATYVSGILNGASATNMNNMLKAQMLGTALDVWFSGPGWTSTKVNNIKPPSNFLSHNSLGGFKMLTTAICPMVDNTTTGTATCANNTPSTDGVASGALPTSPMAVQAILDFASTVPSPFNGSTSNSIWYAGNRTFEEILKNVFDQINNQLAFGSF